MQRFGFGRADPLAKISQVLTPNRQRRARHYAAAIVPENHPPQHRREIDRRGVEREKLRRFAGALDPVNMLRRALLEENRDPVTGIANPASEFLQLRF